mgnify:CR=1 FL=1
MNNVGIQDFIIIQNADKQYLAVVITIKEHGKELIVQCYQPPFSQLSYIRIFNKIENNMTIQWNQIVARVDFQPTVGRRNQLLLSKEQFNMIRTQCSQK